MKKSSLKNYITLLEADNEIAELKADAAANARDYWMHQHELRDEELLEAKHRITLLEEDNERLRRLDDNGGPCALRVKLTAETCGQAIKRLWKDKERLRADNERLRRHFADCTEHNHPFERDHNDTQA